MEERLRRQSEGNRASIVTVGLEKQASNRGIELRNNSKSVLYFDLTLLCNFLSKLKTETTAKNIQNSRDGFDAGVAEVGLQGQRQSIVS
jgi:hypothetical protein